VAEIARTVILEESYLMQPVNLIDMIMDLDSLPTG
jgi:hypothetical protein